MRYAPGSCNCTPYAINAWSEQEPTCSGDPCDTPSGNCKGLFSITWSGGPGCTGTSAAFWLDADCGTTDVGTVGCPLLGQATLGLDCSVCRVPEQ